MLKGNLWLVFGLGAYSVMSLASIIMSIQPVGLAANLYMAVDWMASSTFYFFIGALIGLVIDRKAAKPGLWTALACGLWLISSVLAFIIGVKPFLAIIFPLAYSIFFTGFSFTMIFPVSFVRSYFGKLIFDMLYLALFFSWVYLTYKRSRFENALATALFAVLTLGMVGCIGGLK